MSRRGRPRHSTRRRPGATAREEILDAAAELFTHSGFSGTSTRAIADAVGIKQASLYSHFSTKSEVLATLLQSTVAPTLAFADRLDREHVGVAPAAKLYLIAAHDSQLLASAPWNIGILYVLPEVRNDPAFAEFNAQRRNLQERYRSLVVAACGENPIPRPLQDLPFFIVESVINVRSRSTEAIDPSAWAHAALRAVGLTVADPVPQIAGIAPAGADGGDDRSATAATDQLQ